MTSRREENEKTLLDGFTYSSSLFYSSVCKLIFQYFFLHLASLKALKVIYLETRMACAEGSIRFQSDPLNLFRYFFIKPNRVFHKSPLDLITLEIISGNGAQPRLEVFQFLNYNYSSESRSDKASL